MRTDTSRDGTSEVDRNRVSDQPAQGFDFDLLPLGNECVVWREGLDQRSVICTLPLTVTLMAPEISYSALWKVPE